MSEKNRFGEYIANLRNEKGISLKQLSDGLCDYTLLGRFERGKREPDKLLQNRILTRLGTVPENYENFLHYKDYCRWEMRQGIVHHILEQNITAAGELLEKYGVTYSMSEPLEEQFYLAMLAQIRWNEGAAREELAEIYKRALELTVPEIMKRGLEKRVLSLEELNLLLEYIFCSEERGQLHWYEDMIGYIKGMKGTQLAMAKIFPKVVYYYYSAMLECCCLGTEDVRNFLSLSGDAIELLRNANRMFYMWELLKMKETLMQMLPEDIQKTEDWKKEFLECRNWRETLEEIYEEYHVPIEMFEFCYLYVESENYCIGDVIRIRREMLGIDKKELCEGICSTRTLERLERNETEPQRYVIKNLFERLNLSTELNRTELVTDNPEAIEKYKELKKCSNNRNFEKVQTIIEELKREIPMEIPLNQQVIMRNETLGRFNEGIISNKEYILKLQEALNCTVSYEKACLNERIYFTNEEIACIQNLALKTEWESKSKSDYMQTLEKLSLSQKYPENYMRVYEFAMNTVSSYLGNMKQFERSDDINKSIIKMCLVTRRISGIHGALYGLLWNNENNGDVSNKKLTSVQRKSKLNQCIGISNLYKKEYYERLYREKLHEIK